MQASHSRFHLFFLICLVHTIGSQNVSDTQNADVNIMRTLEVNVELLKGKFVTRVSER